VDHRSDQASTTEQEKTHKQIRITSTLQIPLGSGEGKTMKPVTKRDLTIRRIAINYMALAYRQSPTINNQRNIALFFAHRHHYVYDFSPIPCPVRRW
jgi:hypothetical protein